jgi:signal transduction histidine kinase
LLRHPDDYVPELERVSETNKLVELSNAVGRVQHEMNNPLAALLAESQLLELDPTLNAEQRDSVKRIVDLARRVIASSRKLDALREKN